MRRTHAFSALVILREGAANHPRPSRRTLRYTALPRCGLAFQPLSYERARTHPYVHAEPTLTFVILSASRGRKSQLKRRTYVFLPAQTDVSQTTPRSHPSTSDSAQQ